jgi:acetyl esterase/lipase
MAMAIGADSYSRDAVGLPAGGCAMRFGTEITRSVPYAGGPRHTLDVARRRTAVASPVIVFFYGGGWRSGNKAMYRYVAKALASRGYLVVIPDYRIYPEVCFPDFLRDGALAVRWVRDNAGRFGGDPAKIFLMGHSAGAYVAAMLAVDESWLCNVGLVPGHDIAGLMGIAGPYDFLPLRDDTLKVIFGGANRPATQPIFHVSAGAPPALLLTGGKDRIVEPGNAARFALRLRAAGNDATVVTYPRLGHLLIIAAFAPLLRIFIPVLHDIEAFIAKTVRSPQRAQHVEAAT